MSDLRKAKDKMRQLVIDIAKDEVARGNKQVIRTPVDIFGICLRDKIFTKDEIKALENTYPAIDEGSGSVVVRGPSPNAAKDVLEELCHDGKVTRVKISHGNYVMGVYDISEVAKEDA